MSVPEKSPEVLRAEIAVMSEEDRLALAESVIQTLLHTADDVDAGTFPVPEFLTIARATGEVLGLIDHPRVEEYRLQLAKMTREAQERLDRERFELN